jgi:hypothetical protein
VKGCLQTLAAFIAWFLLFAVNLVAVLIFVGADSITWRALALACAAASGALTLLAGKHERFARALTHLSLAPWSASYEADYRQTTGVHSGPLVAGTPILLWSVGAAVALVLGH